MRVTQSTHIGQRNENQDAMFFKEYEKGVLAIVCDGMGGGVFGKEAATLACTTFFAAFDKLYNDWKNIENYSNWLNFAIAEANEKVYEAARGDVMGATCVASFITEDTVHTVNIGDSRAYLITKEEIKQITTDHSHVQELYEKGLITYAETLNHPEKNILTKVLGVMPEISSDYFKTERNGGRIMLCTDGLTNTIDDDKILKIFNKSRKNTISKNLTEISVLNNGKDNITVIVVD